MPYSAVTQPSPLPFVARHFFFDRGGAQHLGVAKLDQHRALGVLGEVAGDAHSAQLVGGAAAVTGVFGHGGKTRLKVKNKPKEATVCAWGTVEHGFAKPQMPPPAYCLEVSFF